MNKRTKGSAGETLATEYYLSKWYTHIESNFTIRWGEIDLIVENDNTTVFVEVKVVDHIDDLFWYVTEKKLYFLHKTIEHYMREYETKKQIRIDVVFIQSMKIYQVYENVGWE